MDLGDRQGPRLVRSSASSHRQRTCRPNRSSSASIVTCWPDSQLDLLKLGSFLGGQDFAFELLVTFALRNGVTHLGDLVFNVSRVSRNSCRFGTAVTPVRIKVNLVDRIEKSQDQATGRLSEFF